MKMMRAAAVRGRQFGEVAKALRRYGEGHPSGKVVISMENNT